MVDLESATRTLPEAAPLLDHLIGLTGRHPGWAAS
jgi:hypothetical protein